MPRNPNTVRASIFVIATLALSSGLALAKSVQQCKTHIMQPHDGQTAVSPDIVIQGSFTCTPTAPQFIDDSGAVVPAAFVISGSEFTLTPSAPLPPDGTFMVRFNEKPHCTQPPNKITFSTKAKPALRNVDVAIAEGQLHAVSIRLSEPVKNMSDLANMSFVSVNIDGFSPKATISPAGPDEAFATYKPLAQRPSSDRTVHVHVAKELAFASGAALSEDIDVSFTPDEWPTGYFPTGTPEGCDFASSSGCQVSAAPVPAPLPSILGMIAGILMVARRRRSQ